MKPGGPLKRKTGLRNSGKLSQRPILRKTRINRVKPERAEQLRQYYARIPSFLEEHPFCQIWLREHGVTAEREKEILQAYRGAGSPAGFRINGERPPRSTQVHHANKRRGARLLDEKDWFAASREWHDRVEGNKGWARRHGYLKNF